MFFDALALGPPFKVLWLWPARCTTGLPSDFQPLCLFEVVAIALHSGVQTILHSGSIAVVVIQSPESLTKAIHYLPCGCDLELSPSPSLFSLLSPSKAQSSLQGWFYHPWHLWHQVWGLLVMNTSHKPWSWEICTKRLRHRCGRDFSPPFMRQWTNTAKP